MKKKSILKAYEVVTGSGKTVWIAAPSKKTITDFFDRPKAKAVHLRKDVDPNTCNTVL
jgi:hypothetical protein